MLPRVLLCFLSLYTTVAGAEDAQRWSQEASLEWYKSVDWPVGANFVPSTAINQLEMWQADTFDPATIDRELGWAAKIGMNTMRVFLHDLAWTHDPDGFLNRVDKYLDIANRHGIRTMIVFFDGVWYPYPKPGTQPKPEPGLHNSGWVQSPGRPILEDPSRHEELKPYVQAVLRRFKDDRRVLIWDLFNEPENSNANSYGASGSKEELEPAVKLERSAQLLAKTFAWSREIGPSQPLTCGVWMGDYLNNPNPVQRISLESSDVISFHSYDGPDQARRTSESLLKLGRPVLCTEYMARGNKSTFETVLPIFHEHKIGAYNWGLVDGKSQTIYPWDSWGKAYTAEPKPWHHDVFRRDGTSYAASEVDTIRTLTFGLTKASKVSAGIQDSTIPLWPQGAPDDNGLTGNEKTGSCVGNISKATLSIHLPPADNATGSAVVVLPGGGYGVVCDKTEGQQIAEILVPHGIAAIVVKYRLPNQHHRIPANDARRAIRTVRHLAKQWNIDANKVGVWGFSAGGHLASTVSTVFDSGDRDSADPIERQGSRPDFSVLFYPVISMESGVTHNGSRHNLLGANATDDLVKQYSNEQRVTRNTPPTFILHAADDKAVPVENTLRYYRQLVAHDVPSRLVIFETGGHGPTAFKQNPSWLPVFEDWISAR